MGHFDDLLRNVARLRSPDKPVKIDTRSPPSELPKFTEGLATGIEISLDELDSSHNVGGLLAFRGSQIILYIRDHGSSLDSKIRSRASRPKFHVADCSTLRAMRAQDRFGRYVVTNDVTGEFRLDGDAYGVKKSAVVELDVCKNCLKHLNYEGYRSSQQARSKVFARFKLSRFFVTYSTVFSTQPNGGGFLRPFVNPQVAKIGAPDAQGCIACDDCGARLDSTSALLFSTEAGCVQCADCRRRPPGDEAILVTKQEMRTIADARHAIWHELDSHSWENAFKYSDPSFHGLLHLYRRQGQAVPEPGVELLGYDGAVCVELGLAWSVSRHAVVLNEDEKQRALAQGWDAMTLAEALLDGQQDG